MKMTSTVKQQQKLTEFFAARKSARQSAAKQATQALDKLKALHADLEEIKIKKANLRAERPTEAAPSYKRYANLLVPKAEIPPSPKKAVGKNALSRLEAKKAALKAAREKLRQVETDQQALKEFQETKKPPHVIEVPAYEKYHYLSVPSETLPLPIHYKKLFDGFVACDTVVSMFHNREELCRLDKLCLAVRKMTRHNFGLKDLAKILSLKPDAYKVTVEEHRFVDCTQKLHHIVSFGATDFGPKILLSRKRQFKEKLLLRAAQFHQEFVDKELPGSNIPVEALKRWHPKFELDSVPDILEAELPKIHKNFEIAKAKDVLEKVRGKFSARIEKALQLMADKEEKEAAQKSSNKSPSKKPITGVNQSLLERIKKKEALKMAEKMVMGGETAKEQQLLQALPPLIRTIRQIFLSSQKAAILYTDLITKLQDSTQHDDLDEKLNRLAEIAPEWYKPLTVRNSKYVKIDKNKDINGICDRVEKLAKAAGSQ